MKAILIPVDADGNSIDDHVVQDVVQSALESGPVVAFNHIQGKFNALYGAMMADHLGPDARYQAAIALAGEVMRYAWEHRHVPRSAK